MTTGAIVTDRLIVRFAQKAFAKYGALCEGVVQTAEKGESIMRERIQKLRLKNLNQEPERGLQVVYPCARRRA